MTEELKQAAQQAIEALDEIHAGKRHPQLALAVAHNLRRALNQRPAAQTWDKNADVCKGAWELGTACGTCAKCIATKPAQRPAAQTERGLFEELWAKPNNVQLTLDVNQRDYHYPQAKAGWSAWQFRASLPAPPQQATPEPDDDGKWRDVALRFDKHRMQALWHLQAMLKDPAKHADIVRQFLKDPTHPAAATPEPVGEPALTRYKFLNIEGEELCPVERLRGFLPIALSGQDWLDVEPFLDALTRPAPGVTETDADALLDFMEAHRVSVTPEYEGQWCARQYDDEPQAVAEFEAATPRDAIRALAAAQAKGGKA